MIAFHLINTDTNLSCLFSKNSAHHWTCSCNFHEEQTKRERNIHQNNLQINLILIWVQYQGFIQALLIMSILWQKSEFCKGESDLEAVLIAAGSLEGWGNGECCNPPPAVSFFHYRVPSFSPNFFPPHESLSFPIITWNRILKSKKKSWKFEWVSS